MANDTPTNMTTAEFLEQLRQGKAGGYLPNPNANTGAPSDYLLQALTGGQAAPVYGANGEVTGFNWGNIKLPAGLTESQNIAALQAALGSASMQAQQADSAAAVQKLTNLLSTIKNSQSLAQYKDLVSKAIGTAVPAQKDYRSSASPINAWADNEIQKNALYAERTGKAGSSEVRDRATQINMLRGEKLADALLKSNETYRKAVQDDLLRKANLAQNLFEADSNPELSLQKAIASLFNSRQYVAPRISWQSGDENAYTI